MSTLVRVKRHRSEINSDSLVLRLKKQRVNEEVDTNFETVLTYAGTLDTKNGESRDEVVKLARNFPNIDKRNTLSDFREKARTNQARNRKERVLRIIDSFRQKTDEQNCCIIDAESQSQDHNSNNDGDDDEYVYDVFLTEQNYDTSHEFDNHEVIIEEVVNDDLVYYNHSDNESSVDSNSENYYGNDYPDTEPDDYEQFVLDQMDKLDLGNELSSDDDCNNYYFDNTSGDHTYTKYIESNSDSSD